MLSKVYPQSNFNNTIVEGVSFTMDNVKGSTDITINNNKYTITPSNIPGRRMNIQAPNGTKFDGVAIQNPYNHQNYTTIIKYNGKEYQCTMHLMARQDTAIFSIKNFGKSPKGTVIYICFKDKDGNIIPVDLANNPHIAKYLNSSNLINIHTSKNFEITVFSIDIVSHNGKKTSISNKDQIKVTKNEGASFNFSKVLSPMSHVPTIITNSKHHHNHHTGSDLLSN